ncbi:WXG100 family type VII secretion target [Streptomyces sp. BBFR2]|uniref:WXG100 family type VII secretion target n=1 Tax=Streptomyces sp. BBFR2 TaxID=3372854 RepID=UPI0037DA6FBF
MSVPTNYNFVDTGSMRTAISDFEDTQNQLNSVLRTVQGTLQGLTSGWTGDTAQQYQRVMSEWTAHFEKVYGDLGRMVTVLNDSVANYERTNSANHEAVGSIQSVLGAG